MDFSGYKFEVSDFPKRSGVTGENQATQLINFATVSLHLNINYPPGSAFKSSTAASFSITPPSSSSCPSATDEDHPKYSSASTAHLDQNLVTAQRKHLEHLLDKYNLSAYFPSPKYCLEQREGEYFPPPGTSLQRATAAPRDFQISSLTMENVITVERNSPSPFERVEGLCRVPARSAGLVSLVVQAISLVIALLLTTLLFVHVGGYGMLLGADQVVGNVSVVNTTQFPTSVASLLALEELGDEVGLDTSTEMAAADNTTTWNETIAVDQGVDLIESTTPEEDLTRPKSDNIWQPTPEPIYHGPFEQLQEIQLKLSNMQVELLPILRASCMLYAGFCIAWLISLVGLLLSLKLEILDLVYINTFLLAVITTYTFAKVFLVGIVIFYQKEFRWNTLLTISFTVGGLILCFIFQVVALCFIVIWYRYIDYMNGGDESCLCTSSIVECIKGQRKSRGKPAANDYSIPEATRHSNLPYIDDPSVQQFSNF